MEHSFLTEDVAGLDIADGYIAAARLRFIRRGCWEITNAGWAAYDSSLQDKGLAEEVRALWRQCEMPTSTVCSCIGSASVAFHYFKHTQMSKEELESALCLQGEEMLQMPREDIAIDWHLNRSAGNDQNEDRPSDAEGVLFTAPLKDVDRHLRILEMAGLYPVVLDVSNMALSNLFLELSDGVTENETLCLVNLSAHGADAAILSGSQWIYPHTISSRTTAWEQSMDYLCTGINEMLKYCQYKLHRGPVTRLIVTGRIPLQEQFPALLQNGTGLPVEIWDPLPLMKVGPAGLARELTADRKAGPLLATSLGLALRRD